MTANPEKFFASGEFRSSRTGEVFKITNPYTGEVVWEISKAGREDFDTSLTYLESAFRKYCKESVYTKAGLLSRIAHRIDKNSELLAETITKETGKPLKYSRIEVQRAILTFTLGSEEASRINGEYIDLSLIKGSEGMKGIVKRFPVGIILAITPWNFPVNLVAHKISPALASGNVVLLKPASASAKCGLELMKIIKESCDEMGLSYYPVNVITAPGNVAEEFASDKRVKMVSFTGSSEVGWKLKKKLDRQKISLELGGNAGVIVDKSADVKDAAKKIAVGAFAQSGQSCISVQRVFVHNEIFDNFLELLRIETDMLKVGDPFEEDTDIASMISEEEAIRAESWIAEAVRDEARILSGGKRANAVLSPTVLCNTRKEMRVNMDEVFAPVVTVTGFDEIAESIRMINDSAFGLQAGVFTKDIENAFLSFEEIETGGVIINHVSTYRMDAMPYGGLKDSGNAREGVRYAIEEMTERKIMVIGN